MEPPHTLFQLPIEDLLFKINPSKAAQFHLMPIHWQLYSDLLNCSDDANIFCGSNVPETSKEIFNELLTREIITQHPISYDQWSQNFAPSQKPLQIIPLEADDQPDPEANATSSYDFVTQLEADITPVVTSANSSTEIDLDFLDA